MAELPEREWTLPGPAALRLTVKQVAEHFGYELRTWRDLIARGLVPRPRGHGQGQYYTGRDVAIITEMFGRWAPEEAPADDAGSSPAANVAKTAESGTKRRKTAESGEDCDS